jgi:hypothetical protein
MGGKKKKPVQHSKSDIAEIQGAPDHSRAVFIVIVRDVFASTSGR